MYAILTLLGMTAAFLLMLFIVAQLEHMEKSKGGRERFVLQSWDPRCWVGLHAGVNVSTDETDCRYFVLECQSCAYGWRSEKQLWTRTYFGCDNGPKCACQNEEEIPVWGTKEI